MRAFNTFEIGFVLFGAKRGLGLKACKRLKGFL